MAASSEDIRLWFNHKYRKSHQPLPKDWLDHVPESVKLEMEASYYLDSDLLTDAIDCYDKIIELEPSKDTD